MATTTNYGWTTPNDTDLVKDGAAAIRTLGSSIDTTTKNLNPQTTTGALAYRSATANINTALPIGTAGQVLKVNSGATAPEWGAAAAGALTLITSSTFTTVSSHSIDNCFTSTYANYLTMITFTDGSTTTSQNLTIKFRAGGTDTSSGYATNQFVQTGTYTDPQQNRQGTDELFVGVYQGNEAKKCAVGAYIYAPQLSQPTMLTGTSTYKDQYNVGQYFIQGLLDNSTAYDGLTLIVSSGTMNGTVRIYGIQNS